MSRNIQHNEVNEIMSKEIGSTKTKLDLNPNI